MKNILKLAVFISIALISSALGQQISGGGGGGTPAGSNKQFQYNNAGAFAGSDALVTATACGMFTNCVIVGNSGSSLEPFLGGNIWGSGDGGNVNYIMEMAVQDVIVKNAGLNDCWGSQANGGGDGSGLRGSKDTCLARNVAGVVEINNGTLGTLAALKLSTLTATTLASDATHTDATVCVDTTTGLFLKGSGAVGICLGTSSARFKSHIEPLGSSLAQIVSLKPSQFFYIPGYGDDGARQQLGFIAEEVVKVAPQLVGLDNDGRPNSVDILAMVPMLVKAMQEQQIIITCLRQKKSKC